MKPQISEFSYGFALTNELVGWAELSAAPVFPSLLEEGKAGGGYDVKLERPGVPLYLQFKRSEFLTRRSGREAREIEKNGGKIGIPYYRFAVTEAAISAQHELLLALDVAPNFVFYAAPRFHRLDEINQAWHDNAVASRSKFVAPQTIGSLTNERHTVAFDGRDVWVCSEPRQIDGLTSRELADKLTAALKNDTRPLGDKLPEISEDLRVAEERGRSRIYQRLKEEEAEREAARQRRAESFARFDSGGTYSVAPPSRVAFSLDELQAAEVAQTLTAPLPEPVPVRSPKELSPELRLLRTAADAAARTFDSQLIIIQPLQ